MHDPRNTPPQPIPDLSAALAAAIVGQLDLDHLARRIADHLRDTPSISPDYDPDTPYPVKEICKELGAHKRQGRITHLTFQRRYIDTGLLKYCAPPPNGSRSQVYVRLGDWLNLKAQTEQKKYK